MSLRSILEIDARLSNQMRVAEQPGLLRNVSVFFAHSGDSWFWGLALILLWVFTDDPFWKKWAVVLFGGISVLAVIVMSLKFSIRRRRPEGEWGGIYRNTDPHSFPSGHAARAFLIAVCGNRAWSRLGRDTAMDLGAAGLTGACSNGRALCFRHRGGDDCRHHHRHDRVRSLHPHFGLGQFLALVPTLVT